MKRYFLVLGIASQLNDGSLKRYGRFADSEVLHHINKLLSFLKPMQNFTLLVCQPNNIFLFAFNNVLKFSNNFWPILTFLHIANFFFDVCILSQSFIPKNKKQN